MPQPSMLTVGQAVLELNANPGRYTTYQSLLDLAARVPVDPVVSLPPGSPTPVTLAYSGGSGTNGLSMQPIAAAIGSNSGGAVRVIDQSPVSQFLQHPAFLQASNNVTQLLDPTLIDRTAITAATNNNFLYDATKGPWAEASARFMAAAPGDVISLTPLASSQRTFAQIEIEGFLNNPNSQSFNGIPKEVFQQAYDLEMARSGRAGAIAAVTDLAAVTSGINVASEIRVTTALDASGRPVMTGLDTGALFEGRGGSFSGVHAASNNPLWLQAA
jgi:hypothetical protein